MQGGFPQCPYLATLTFSPSVLRTGPFDKIDTGVLDEAGDGDADAARRRLEYLRDLPLLTMTPAVSEVAKAIMESGLLPRKAARDTVHIAVASVHDCDILLTWNCRHIANAAIMKELGEIVAQCGYDMPVLCTPEELLGD